MLNLGMPAPRGASINFMSLHTAITDSPDSHSAEIQRLMRLLELERAARAASESALAQKTEILERIQRSELYFRHLTEYSLDFITILDADGTIRFESHSIEKELGYHRDDYLGKNAFDFLHPDDVPRVMQSFINALQSHGNTPVLSFRFRHKDGSYRVLEGCGNNLLNAPEVRGIVFNSRDVTDKRRIEEQFQQSQKVQAIGQLTGGVAHDFNNILTAILGYADLAMKQLPESATPHQQVGEIRKAAERAEGLTRQLLAFSRKQVLKPRVINLVTAIADMEKMLRRLLGEAIEFATIADADVGNVVVDQSQLEQVLLNLTVNARDAMPEGGKLTINAGNITLDAAYAGIRNEVEPGEYVMLAISDTGTGMTEEVRARLFEPFFTTKEQGKGTGLGLATCHGIVKQSGGHISVYSELGTGTTFKVYLPRVMESVTVEARAEAPQPMECGHETVLIVEDEPMLRELGETVLQDLGYRVFCAENGRRALALLDENPDLTIDLLFTDMMMPEMGGRELVEKLRPLSPNTKVIYCSGYTEDAVFRSGGIEAGVFFLQKPYTVAAVAKSVRDALSAPTGK